jgi:hypothetical protein
MPRALRKKVAETSLTKGGESTRPAGAFAQGGARAAGEESP